MIQAILVGATAVPDNRPTVRAIVNRGLALHLNHPDPRLPQNQYHRFYVLSHVESGLKVAMFSNRAIALAAFKTLAQSFDFSLSQNQIVKQENSIKALLSTFLMQDVTDDEGDA